jgi:hydrophobe/amphiphile efflux-1 (HAE1) family protein
MAITLPKFDLTALGVRRPVFITVVNILIMLAGLAAFLGVDVRELPNVDRPVVSVNATYPGASPKTMDTEVTSIIEGSIARVSGVKRIESASEENNMRMRIEFNPGVDLDDAASDVREAVSRVQRDLPDDIEQIIVVKADDEAESIVQMSAYSNDLSKQELAERIEKDVAPEFLSINGVADVRLNGDQPRTLRVALDPPRMAGYNISARDVVNALTTARFDVPAGSYESVDQELIVRSYASVVEPEKVERLHVLGDTRIEDIGEAFYAPQEATSYSLLNGRQVIGLGIIRQAGSNTISIAAEAKRRMANINQRADDFELVVTSNDAVYIQGALTEVGWSLAFAVIIVLVVIALFIGRWRTVLIPAVTMPIALIGTVAAIWALGFSINLLTLLALVLATGLIVDDAIVVLENIQRRSEQGIEKMAAAVLGTRQVFFAVLATTITLVAVFLPIAFLPGETGRLFREFGLVLAIAVMISSFVAVTLCPMMVSRLPDIGRANNPVFDTIRGGLQSIGGKLAEFYFATLNGMLNHKWMALFLALLIAGGGIIGFFQLNQELLPQEDRGNIRVFLTGPDGANLNYANRQAQKVEAALQPYQDIGLITDIYTIVGRWDLNRAYIIAQLADWDQRDVTQMALAAEISDKISGLPGAQVRVIQGSSLDVGGGGVGLEMAPLGNDYDDIFAAANQFSLELQQRLPAVTDVRVQYDTSQPELSFNIDRDMANELDVSMDEISQTMRVMVDQYDVIDINVEDQAIPIMVGPLDGVINDPGDLKNIFLINEYDNLVPLSAIVTMQERGVAAELDRHEQRRAIDLDIGVPPGTALGDVINDIRRVADDVLPGDISPIFLGEAATLQETNLDVAATFAIALAVVFLVLAAQFESFGSAIIVIFTVPFGLAAAVFALLITGQTINLYSQIGLVMLVGLMTKNAILLIEFMDQLRDDGADVRDAIRDGVKVRLRPVMMTVISTVFGALPLILSGGPGAEARNAIGWVIFGGLGLSTLFTLYLTPLGYWLIAPHLNPRRAAGHQLKDELKSAEEKGLITRSERAAGI